jgi:hypothetical protein
MFLSLCQAGIIYFIIKKLLNLSDIQKLAPVVVRQEAENLNFILLKHEKTHPFFYPDFHFYRVFLWTGQLFESS